MTNPQPPFPELTQAYGVRMGYRDCDVDWDSTGTCAGFATFTWSNV